jgi:uncharacterized cupredoxin-like copper-binding protein
MVNPRALAFCALAAGTLFLGGCGGTAGETASAGPSMTVTGIDAMKYAPDTLNVKAGEPVTIVFKNSGIIAHDLVTSGADKNVKLVNLGSGKQQRATFEANKPGTYEFVCQQPGHKEAGMVGKIVVS